MSECLRLCLIRNLSWWIAVSVGFFLTAWFVTDGSIETAVMVGVISLAIGIPIIAINCYARCRRQG